MTETERLRALLRRWVELKVKGVNWGLLPTWVFSVDDGFGGTMAYTCRVCRQSIAIPEGGGHKVWKDIPHVPGCIVGDTLKELGQ